MEIIINSVNDIFKRIEHKHYDFVTKTDYNTKKRVMKGFKHRFNDEEDMAFFLHFLNILLINYGSIEGFFNNTFEKTMRIKDTIVNFSKEFRMLAKKILGKEKSSILFFLPSPENGCACKRINMYLRWMVRKNDGIDLGVWKTIPASALIIPLDVHITKIAKLLNITERKSADWQMAEEITDFLKKIDPTDPLKFDFSLCNYGKLKFRKEIV